MCKSFGMCLGLLAWYKWLTLSVVYILLPVLFLFVLNWVVLVRGRGDLYYRLRNNTSFSLVDHIVGILENYFDHLGRSLWTLDGLARSLITQSINELKALWRVSLIELGMQHVIGEMSTLAFVMLTLYVTVSILWSIIPMYFEYYRSLLVDIICAPYRSLVIMIKDDIYWRMLADSFVHHLCWSSAWYHWMYRNYWYLLVIILYAHYALFCALLNFSWVALIGVIFMLGLLLLTHFIDVDVEAECKRQMDELLKDDDDMELGNLLDKWLREDLEKEKKK